MTKTSERFAAELHRNVGRVLAVVESGAGPERVIEAIELGVRASIAAARTWVSETKVTSRAAERERRDRAA